jgi:hypothetical protein
MGPGGPFRPCLRHTQLTAAEDVEVQVLDLLPGVLAVVYPDRIPPLRDTLVLRYRLGGAQQPMEYLRRQVRLRGYVLSRDNQYVHRRMGIQILERYQVVFLIHELGIHLSPSDLAERAILLLAHKTSP